MGVVVDTDLAISTNEAFSSNWCDLKAPKVEVLVVLNVESEQHSLLESMGQLKVLSVTSNAIYPAQLHNLPSIGVLSSLKRLRFEHLSLSVSSIQPIFALQNLQKLSFVMCEVGNALMNGATEARSMLPNLTELEFDRCYDLNELPEGLCSLVRLQKLSISNCHELEVLPEGLGSLLNLEYLGLNCCTKLQELPESIGSLVNLRFIDICDCLSISMLPEGIGELCSLRVVKMSGCRGLQELPVSMSKLLRLEEVICDEETSYLWMDFESDLYNLKINIVEDDRLESLMKIVQ